MMQTRPSMVRINNRCVRRRTIWNLLLFVAIVIVLLCLEANIVLAMLASGAILLLLKLFAGKK